MQIEEKKQNIYPYDFNRICNPEFISCTQTVGKLPKIRLALPKISIVENFELKIA